MYINKKLMIENFVSTNEMNPAMCRIYFDGEFLTATNGHKLISVKANADGGDNRCDEQYKETPILIHPKVFKIAHQIGTIKRNDPEMRINILDGGCCKINDVITITDGWMNESLMNKFPNYKQVLKNNTIHNTIYLDLGMLKKVLRDTNLDKVKLTMGKPIDPITIHSINRDDEFVVVQMPVRGNG